ncbi:MAG: hypothetical protein LBG92_11140, partial [Prevotellaceae bacterium]|nr:hypothetical protein [Prevotellaceae bacterium]
NITVRQIHNGQTVDSFSVQPDKESYDAVRTRYYFYIDKPLYIRDTFQIAVSGCEPYILSDMKMVMHPQFTMLSEGWGCVMRDYKINGVHFEDNGGPDFVKEGFKFPWEKEE